MSAVLAPYTEFIAAKGYRAPDYGVTVEADDLHPAMMPFRIEWARPIWYGIRESDTLNVAEGRDKDDERHIAPLQLGTIERCVRLFTNPCETVLTPFLGIGSEAYEAVRLGRKAIGIELKERYFWTAIKNVARAETLAGGNDLFSYAARNGHTREGVK